MPWEGNIDAKLTPAGLKSAQADGFGPVIVDVRRATDYAQASGVIPGSLSRDPGAVSLWSKTLDLGRPIVAYCVHGHEVSQGVSSHLRECGLRASYLQGGIEAWLAAGHPITPKPGKPTAWVTRERPKIDRIACPWLIRRFIDPNAEFIYVAAGDVITTAQATGAIPYDVPGVEFTHVGERCSFDTFIAKYNLTDPALLAVAEVVRGADTDRLDLAAPAAGLFAISLGLSANVPDDHEMLRYGLLIYDALYRWHRDLRTEAHNWPPVKLA